MRQTWSWGGFALAAALGAWRCAIDDRSTDQVQARNQPGDAGLPVAMTPDTVPRNATPPSTPDSPPSGGNGAAGAGNGAAGAGNGAAGNGGTPGVAGAGNAGTTGNAGTAGNSAGAGGSTPTGASGAGGVDPFDPFGTGGDPPASSTCPAFTACGGELEGAWSYSDVCSDTSSVAILQAAVCPTVSLRIEPGGTSTLTFGSGQVSRLGAPQGDSVTTFPSDCDLFVACSDLEGAGGECSEATGPCICRVPASVDWSTQTYTVSGGQLSLQDGRTFDYCVQGARLTYTETGSLPQEPGTFTLQRN